MRALAATFAIWIVGNAVAQEPAHAPRPELWRVVERIAAESGLQADLDAVVADLEGVATRFSMPNRTSRVARGLREPWAVPEIAREIRTKLASPFAPGGAGGARPAAPVHWDSFVGNVASLCDVELAVEEPDAWKTVADPAVRDAALVEAMSKLAASLDEMARGCLGQIGAERQKELAAAQSEYMAIDFKTCDPKVKATPEEEAAQKALLKDLRKTRIGPSLSAAAIALRLAEPAFLAALPERLKGLAKTAAPNAEFGGDVVAIFGDSPSNRVVIGGRGKTTWRGRAAIVIDLGGDDVYERAAVVDAPDAMLSLVFDLGGHDTYAGEGCGPAYACGGVAILVDVAGKDTYRGGRLALGSGAFGGFALLADHAGSDTYESQGHGQGFAFGGVGLLYDRAGDDRYDGWAYAQGATQAWGLGALVDWEGNDSYLADLHFADSYGDSGPDVYHGGSQGSSFGLRPDAPGGIAALIDEQGKNTFQAGNFSQGGGYYFGFGVMFSGSGDDKNVGTRYSQGYGVHQAIGVRWDSGGNDAYAIRTVANLGSAWDQGVGYFLDDAGNDVYEAGGLSLGAAANTAIAVFVDGGGKDRYTSPEARDTQGGSGDSSYHGKPSFAALIDLGGQADVYSRQDRKDGALTWQRWCGIFLDAGEASFVGVLRRAAGKLKGAEVPGRDT